MAAEFSRLLTLLRKEKGISQKSAAQQLGVSQALLSHYENGIRECGLDFLVRAADFYGVSCDYILGRTPDRNGLTLTIEELPESDAAGKENSFRNGVQCTLNKNRRGFLPNYAVRPLLPKEALKRRPSADFAEAARSSELQIGRAHV